MMKDRNRFLLGASTLAAALCMAGPAMSQQAINFSVTASPSMATVDALQNRTVNISWASQFDALSQEGEYRTPSDDLLGKVNTDIKLGGGNIPSAEKLTVPVEVLMKAVEMGHTEIRYRRTFTCCFDLINPPVGQAEVLLKIAGAPFEILVEPSRATVAYGTDTVVPLRWTVRITRGRNRKLWVETEEGNFTTKRGRILRPPVRERMQEAGFNEVTFEEELMVSRDIIRKIAAGGESLFRYTRLFMIDGLALEGVLELKIVGAIGEVTTRPESARVAAGRSNTVGVDWQVVLIPGASSAGLTIRSAGGAFYTPDGRLLGRVTRNLSRSMGGKAAARPGSKAIPGEVIEIKETLTVPRDVIQAALGAGFSRLIFRRPFTEGFAEKNGDLNLEISGRIGFGFSIERVELRFLDGTRLKTVASGEPVQAVALVTFTGSGRIYGDWSIADAITTIGAPRFVRKAIVNKPLSGRRRAEIRSPVFSSDRKGLQVVRFRIMRPDLGPENAVTISYIVRAEPEIPADVAEIRLRSPRASSLIGIGTDLSWDALGGTAAYQVEFYPVPSVRRGPPVAGLVVPGATSSIPLSLIAGDHLASRTSYWWRVLAFGTGGELLGQSSLSEVRTR